MGGGIGPPTALIYASPVTGTVGEALTPLVPTLSGHADAFTVLPALPAGLMLDPATGIVSGTPASARLALTYTVTARNAGGFTNSQFLLTVDPPPAGSVVTGVFRSDTVIGLGYVSGAQSGVTNDSGEFTYELGQGVTFSVGRLDIGAVPVAKTLVTPVDLTAQDTGISDRVVNVVRFLMMLDQDGNANNGIQISAAVTAAAASWAPVDFNTADLPTTLGPLIQQASDADGVAHVLPDAATAEAHLRTAFYCTHSGNYHGTSGFDSTPPGMREYFTVSVYPDGRMDSGETANFRLKGLMDHASVDAWLGGGFRATLAHGTSYLDGSFGDATYLSGSYYSFYDGVPGNFQAAGDASVTSTYKFTGIYTETPNDPTQDPHHARAVNFWMDDSNQVSGKAFGALSGSVSGDAFTGTVYFEEGEPHQMLHFPVSGTYLNTASGATFDGQFSTDDSVVTFSTVGCRAN
jgi:hypothetical protein